MRRGNRKQLSISESLSHCVGLTGLVLILSAGVWIPVKVAEVTFGYSLSDAFWQISQTSRSSDVQRSRR